MIKLSTTTAYDVKEAAEILQVAENSVRRFIRARRLRAQKVGKKYYVTEETLKEFLNGDALKNDH